MIIGYARVSTKDQNLEAQIEALQASGCAKIYSEKLSGKSRKRPELEKLMEQLRSDDIIVVTKLDRLARSLSDLVTIMAELSDLGVGFKSLGESIDLSTPAGRMQMGFVDPQGLDYWGIPGKAFEDYGYWERVVFVHFNRNALQTSSDVPCLQDDLSGFSEMEQNSYHIQGIGGAGNTKWVKGNFEAVYDTNGRLVTDPVNRGTYNISPFRDDIPSGARHFRDDMLFYYILGNSPNDPTNYYERVTASYKGALPKTSPCGCNSHASNVMSQLRGLSKP